MRRAARFGVAELLACYRRGVFPMGEAQDDDALFLVDPELRGILPLDAFHVPARLARTMRKSRFALAVDQDFDAVMAACADRRETWINPPIRRLYNELHRLGTAHSVEVRDGPALVGGLYGVALGGAFFGESMFSTADDASKIALVALAARLRAGGFTLLDAQFWTAHLAQFGARQIPRAEFRRLLHDALTQKADFARAGAIATPTQALQSMAQIS